MDKKEKTLRMLTELNAAKAHMISALNYNRDLQTQLKRELRKGKIGA